jgi:hypothetical protein
MKYLSALHKYSGSIDNILKNITLVALLMWNVLEGSVFENEYPYIFVKMYTIPIWRLMLLGLVLTGAMWNRSIGIMMAFTYFFYEMDMEVTMDTWK